MGLVLWRLRSVRMSRARKFSLYDRQNSHFMTDEFHFMTDEFHFMTEPTRLELNNDRTLILAE